MKLVGLLKEIGDSSIKPYPLGSINTREFEDGAIKSYTQKFKDKHNNIIKVSGAVDSTEDGGKLEGYMLDVGFSVGLDTKLTNLHDQYRIMSTVVASLKEMLKKAEDDWGDINYLAFETFGKGAQDTKTAKQRFKLYLAYMKKEFPGLEVIEQKENNYGQIRVLVKFK